MYFRNLGFAISGKVCGQAVNQLGTRTIAMFSELDHRTSGRGADCSDSLAGFRDAAQFRLCKFCEMLKISLSVARSATIHHRRDIIGVEVGHYHPIEKQRHGCKVDSGKLCVSLDCL